MKSKKIMMGILLVLLVIVGIEGMMGFRAEHRYYGAMLLSGKNLALIASAALAGLFPLRYVLKKEKLNFSGLLLNLWAGLGTFSILHALFSKGLVNLFAVFPLLFNTFLLFALAVGFVIGIFAGGSWIVRKLKLFQQVRWQESLLTFGIGLVVFLILMQILMGIQLFYSGVMWLLFAGLLGLAWRERKSIQSFGEPLLWSLQTWKAAKQESKVWWLFTVLFLFSVGYYFFSFAHSYIPYSTAWDANHEYMYVPKIIAENAGVLWGNLGAGGGMPYLWHGFIGFFFSLWAPLGKVLNIAKDTVAVNLNALSGIFVLLFGLGTLKEALLAFKKKEETATSRSAFLTWWALLLLWLSSGMGAFLVFVDNKTDMGVLALSILALLGGLIFLNHFHKKGVHTESRQSTIYLILSALFFAFAVMAKPTAFIDVVVFGLILIGFWLNTTTLIGSWIALLGVMGVIQPLFTAAFIDPSLGKLFFIIGMVIVVIGGIRGLIWRNNHFAKYFKALVLWGVSFVFALFLFKGPWIAVGKIMNKNFDFKDFVKSTLLASTFEKEEKTDSKPRIFLAQTSSNVDFTSQSDLDRETLQAGTKELNYEQCLLEHDDPADLESTKQKAPGSAIHEDVGRYVGYAWRAFKKTGIGGGLLKLLFRKNNTCFGRDRDGLLLCQHREDITQQNFEALETLALQLSKKQLLHKVLQYEESPALQLLNTLLEKEKAGEDLRDAYKALETYYQEHSILTTEESVMIPYRYIVPLNVVFNWSLQNLSSYYTDIGLIWLAVFVLMLGGLGYAIISYDSKHKQLLFLSFATVIGRAIWWAIGGGIVWYGLGLMIWSILTLIALLQEWESKEEKELNTRYLRLLGLLVAYMAIQGLLNAVRIASQASEGPFAHYRSNVSKIEWMSDELQPSTKTTYSFDAQDIFALQFGQYQPFMEAVAERKDEEGILIAGTYLQYFLKNQKNLRMDGLLTRLREEMSDFNSCRSYQRLKNEKLKYLVIDPNIGTVGRAGEGNESLFYRFFARLSPDEKRIQTHGALTMLMKMAQEGYIKLIYTNNLGAKYAFELSDEELKTIFGVESKEDILLLRAKMAVAKFFYQDQTFIEKLFTLFQNRILSGEGIGDIANIMGKKVDEKKLFAVFENILKRNPQGLEQLSQEEKMVFAEYFALFRLMVAPSSEMKTQAQFALSKVFQSSLFGSSQIITLELK